MSIDRGILVASTSHVEWLMPWWWYNYRAHNDLPVAFIDLGMSEDAKSWCQERGELICVDVPDALVFGKERVDPQVAEQWEKVIGSGVWDVRLKWFKKPFAFIRSPFSKTLWIDLDCEIRALLDPLFAHCDNDAGLGLAREPEALQKGYRSLQFTLPEEIAYNSGVVVYRKGAPFLSKWVEEVKERNHLYISDQEALSRVLYLEKPSFQELPAEYNWDRGLGPNPDAWIFHWHGQKGKQMIQEQMANLSALGFVDFSQPFLQKHLLNQ